MRSKHVSSLTDSNNIGKNGIGNIPFVKRKVKTFEDFFEVYDDGVLTARLPLTTDEYATVELHIGSLEPVPDKVVPGNVPQEVTMKQGKLALLHFGLLDTVDQLIAAMPGIQGKATRIEWEYATTIKRQSALVTTIITYLSLTEDKLDELFILANTFE